MQRKSEKDRIIFILLKEVFYTYKANSHVTLPEQFILYKEEGEGMTRERNRVDSIKPQKSPNNLTIFA